MKIQTRLKIGVVLSVVLAMTVGALVFASARSVKKTKVKAEKIAESINYISILQSTTHEYSHFFGERSLAQWRSVCDSLLELFGEWRSSAPEKRSTVDHIISDLQSVKADFSRLVAIVKKIRDSGKQGNALSQELKERLTVQLMVKLQEATSLILQLQREIQSDLASTLYRTSVAIACSLSLLTGLMVGILLWMRSSITKPIINLQEGIRRIGAGHLDHQVGTDATDEVGELSRAFDRMTKDLKKSTASIAVLNREIAERKKAEEALKASEEKYRLMVERSRDGIFVCQNDRFLFVNHAFADLLGYTRRELLSKNHKAICTEEAIGLLEERTRKRRNGETAAERYELLYRKRDGTAVVVEINERIIPYQGQETIFAVVRDITRQKEILKMLEASAAQDKGLEGFIPICAYCSKIQDDEKEGHPWVPPADYLTKRFQELKFSHGVCPDCMKKLYSE